MESISSKFRKLNDLIIDFLSRLKQEGSETSDAAIILARYAKGEDVSKEDMDKFRNQMIDVAKMIGIGIPFTIIPGSTLLLPLVLSIAKRYNIDILPSSFKNKILEVEDIEDLFLEYIDKYNLINCNNNMDVNNIYNSYYIIKDNTYNNFTLSIFINSDEYLSICEDINKFEKRLNRFGYKLDTIINSEANNNQWYLVVNIERHN